MQESGFKYKPSFHFSITFTVSYIDSLRVVLCVIQVQHRAGLAAAVAVLRPVSSQSVSSETHSAFSGDAAQRAPGLGLPAAAAELSEVRSTCCTTHRRWRWETEHSCLTRTVHDMKSVWWNVLLLPYFLITISGCVQRAAGSSAEQP